MSCAVTVSHLHALITVIDCCFHFTHIDAISQVLLFRQAIHLCIFSFNFLGLSRFSQVLGLDELSIAEFVI